MVNSDFGEVAVTEKKDSSQSAQISGDQHCCRCDKDQSLINDVFFHSLLKHISGKINAITGFSEILDNDQLLHQQSEYISDIQEASSSAAFLLNEMIELLEIDSGRVTVVRKKCNLEEVLDEVCAMTQPKAAKKNLEFAIIHEHSLPAILCDSTVLRKCLNALANIAIETTDEGYVHIKVGYQKNNKELTIRFDFLNSVDDVPSNELISGKPKQNYSRMFDTKELQLAVTQRLAQALGGKMSFFDKSNNKPVLSLIISAGLDIDAEKC